MAAPPNDSDFNTTRDSDFMSIEKASNQASEVVSSTVSNLETPETTSPLMPHLRIPELNTSGITVTETDELPST